LVRLCIGYMTRAEDELFHFTPARLPVRPPVCLSVCPCLAVCLCVLPCAREMCLHTTSVRKIYDLETRRSIHAVSQCGSLRLYSNCNACQHDGSLEGLPGRGWPARLQLLTAQYKRCECCLHRFTFALRLLVEYEQHGD